MGRHKTIVETVLDEDQTMPSVTAVKNITGMVAGFSGDTHNASVALAYDWMNRTNSDKDSLYTIELNNYYAQLTGKSILVEYTKHLKTTE